MENLFTKNRIIIICGHYGSGKTNVAVNLALAYKKSYPENDVALADMDIVNPYFRAADAKDDLISAGIRPIIPEFANTNVDIPSLPPELYSLFMQDSKTISFIDVGGDDGAVALGMYSEDILKSGYEMLYVINKFRPLTAEPHEAAELLKIIEASSHLKCTGIVNNSCIGNETVVSDIIESIPYAKECAKLCNLPLCFTSYYDKLVPALDIPGEKIFKMKNVTKQMF